MKNFIKVEINCTSLEESEIFMAELSEINFYAFEQNENFLASYINEEDFDETRLKQIVQKSSYKYSKLENKNWNEEWEQNFKPVTIGNFAAIRASFHKPVTDVEHEIIITPKMSFGTGHHATTFLMIKLMTKINFEKKSVLDFGTGTGILAILAEKCKASSVLAIDYDEWSINNAVENIEANSCKNIIIEQRDTIAGLSCVDIILANINFNVLQENVQNFSKLSIPGTLLIVSGFLISDEDNIVSIFTKNGFIKKQKMQKENWIAMQFVYETIF